MPVINLSLEGKVALVTGGSKGIGRAIALAYAEHGADVCIAARGADALQQTRGEIEELGRRAIAVQADMSIDSDIEALAATVIGEWGGVDVLVNNAGVGSFADVYDATAEQFLDTMRVNVWAPLLLTRLCQPSMLDRGGGVVINVGSAVGVRPGVGNFPYAAYAPSKAALHNLTEVLAKAWAGTGIRVVCLAPGLVKTDLAKDVIERAGGDESKLTPLGWVAEPEDIAGMALLMATQAGAYMSGATYLVDGGEVHAE